VAGSYYELLGVEADATPETIEQAYRERLKETHPDVSDEDDASERTKRLIEAKDVLTDAEERARYDRLGHEAYVQPDGSPGPEADTEPTGAGARRDEPTATAAEGQTAGPSGAGTREGRRHVQDRRDTAGGAASQSWYDGTDDAGWEADTRGWRAWNTDGSYAVERGQDQFRYGRVFVSGRAFVLLLSTFAVYPVLLFGALLPEFPLAVNLTVGLCAVLVIAYLQSIPEVGVAVFGVWSLLLPACLLWLGVDLVSIRALLALVGVVFPFFLSVLTQVAIRPFSAG